MSQVFISLEREEVQIYSQTGGFVWRVNICAYFKYFVQCCKAVAAF